MVKDASSATLLEPDRVVTQQDEELAERAQRAAAAALPLSVVATAAALGPPPPGEGQEDVGDGREDAVAAVHCTLRPADAGAGAPAPAPAADAPTGAAAEEGPYFCYEAAAPDDPMDVQIAELVRTMLLPEEAMRGATLQRIATGRYRFGEKRCLFKLLDDGRLYVRQGSQG